MGSSLPRHSARIRTKIQSRRKEKNPKADCKLAQKNRTKIYMMHEQFKYHDACPNSVKLSLN